MRPSRLIVPLFVQVNHMAWLHDEVKYNSRIDASTNTFDISKSFRAAIGLKFRDFIGVFQTKRIDIKSTLTIKEQRKYKGPVLEFIRVDHFEDLSTNQ